MDLQKAVLTHSARGDSTIKDIVRIVEEQTGRAEDESPLEIARRNWDTFYADWLDPATDLVLPVLAILLVLLICSRLVTRFVVAKDAPEWPRLLSSSSWLGGAFMLFLSSLVPVVVAHPPQPVAGRASVKESLAVGATLLVTLGLFMLALVRRKTHWTLPGGVGAVVGETALGAGLGISYAAFRVAEAGFNVKDAVIAVVVWLSALLLALTTPGRDAGGGSLRRFSHSWVLGGLVISTAIIAGACTTGWLLGDSNLSVGFAPWSVWLWTLSVAFWVVGTVLVAEGRGQKLRLQINVRNAAGQTDTNGSDYVIARLQDLGSAQPRGVEIPEQTDVTALPEDALTSLPQGRIAIALFNVYGRSDLLCHGELP